MIWSKADAERAETEAFQRWRDGKAWLIVHPDMLLWARLLLGDRAEIRTSGYVERETMVVLNKEYPEILAQRWWDWMNPAMTTSVML